MRRPPAVAALLLAAACAPGPVAGGGGEDPTRPAVAVEIDTFAFVPAEVTVPVGTAITWTNLDDFAHTVTSGRAGDVRDDFVEGALGELGEMNGRGTMFSLVVTEPATLAYFCRYHPNMQGVVQVTRS
ncbi:MAG TPA: plastocyanin/azurin family copper-binding protein [Nitriliruptorales bacterium]